MLIILILKLNKLILFPDFYMMKKTFLLLFLMSLFLGCTKDTVRNTNPYIPNYNFSFVINLNLPQYIGLTSAVNPISLTEPSGITMIVMKISDTEYRAWNDYCPNQSISSCSKLIISGNVNAKCGCENYVYSLFTGVGNAQYTLIPYRVEILGNNSIRVYN